MTPSALAYYILFATLYRTLYVCMSPYLNGAPPHSVLLLPHLTTSGQRASHTSILYNTFRTAFPKPNCVNSALLPANSFLISILMFDSRCDSNALLMFKLNDAQYTYRAKTLNRHQCTTTNPVPPFNEMLLNCQQEGVSGEWQGAWVMLIRRVLVYHTKDGALRTVDLRKTRCVGQYLRVKKIVGML